jgi:hypothetical protein
MERTARLKIDLKEKGIPVAVWKLNGSQAIEIIISEETFMYVSVRPRALTMAIALAITNRPFVP